MSKAASMAFQSLTIWKYGFIYTHVLDSFCLSSFLCLYVSLIFRSRFPKKISVLLYIQIDWVGFNLVCGRTFVLVLWSKIGPFGQNNGAVEISGPQNYDPHTIWSCFFGKGASSMITATLNQLSMTEEILVMLKIWGRGGPFHKCCRYCCSEICVAFQ